VRISVIIPTYNRADTLRKTLRAYAEQSGDHQMLEVLVVDDGSKDETPSVMEELARCFPVPLICLRQENRGLAAARNHALREARGDLVLFGDDDIIPSDRMVAEHVTWHQQHPEPEVGVLGLVRCAPEVHPTPFTVWASLYGPQFNFGHFRRGETLNFWHAYFCNTSVKAGFLREHGSFSEAFRQYGWEDLELSYRLCGHGYRLLYNPSALGYHYKFETFEQAIRRVEQMYRSWPVFAQTEAGRCFLDLALQRQQARSRKTRAIKAFLWPLKAGVMRLLRPMLDSYIPLPGRLYDMAFYYYVTPFGSFVTRTEGPCSSGGPLMPARPASRRAP